jgi:hypothetical protein
LDIKLLCEQDGFEPYNQAGSGALCFRDGGVDLWLKIMKTWPDPFGSLDHKKSGNRESCEASGLAAAVAAL